MKKYRLKVSEEKNVIASAEFSTENLPAMMKTINMLAVPKSLEATVDEIRPIGPLLIEDFRRMAGEMANRLSGSEVRRIVISKALYETLLAKADNVGLGHLEIRGFILECDKS